MAARNIFLSGFKKFVHGFHNKEVEIFYLSYNPPKLMICNKNKKPNNKDAPKSTKKNTFIITDDTNTDYSHNWTIQTNLIWPNLCLRHYLYWKIQSILHQNIEVAKNTYAHTSKLLSWQSGTKRQTDGSAPLHTTIGITGSIIMHLRHINVFKMFKMKRSGCLNKWELLRWEGNTP